jgi:lysozyme family protein
MERFDKFIQVILDHEGGLVDDVDDLGGLTNMGITRRRYPDIDIKNLTVAQAKQIYYDDFYKPLNLYYIKNDLLALHLFDMAVNAGKKNAILLLQGLLHGCDNDGVIGPISAQSIAYADITTNLVEAYKAKRIEYYYKVSLRRNNKKFLKGWVNRVYKTEL